MPRLRTAGMHTLGVTNTVTEADLRAAGAEVVTKDLADWNVDAVKLVFNRRRIKDIFHLMNCMNAEDDQGVKWLNRLVHLTIRPRGL